MLGSVPFNTFVYVTEKSIYEANKTVSDTDLTWNSQI